MRTGLFVVAALVLASPVSAADPQLPPITFQAQPAGQVLDQFRIMAEQVGGEKGVKAFNTGLKGMFGEKGLEGLDINRPIVGYVILAPKPQDITAVIALPVEGEKEFLAFCDRINKDKLKADEKDKSLYHLPPLDPRYKALLRFSEGYAYIVYGFNPAPHAGAKALVPMPKLYDPGERGLIAARVHFDRIPADVKAAAPVLLKEVRETLFPDRGGGRGGIGFFGIGQQEAALFKPLGEEIEKLVTRYVKLADGGDVLSARFYLDPQADALVAEATLTAKPGSELAKKIGAYKTAPNKFAGLLNHPDVVAGFATRLPLFEPELRAGAAGAFGEFAKEAAKNAPPEPRGMFEELLKGFARAAKKGDFDVSLAVRGPDKKGWFSGVAAVAYDDPAALEKEVKALVKKSAPQAEQDRITWDAAKAGDVSIHTWKQTVGGFFDYTKAFGGEDCVIAFAFAPHGLFGAIGTDPVSLLKDAIAMKPADSALLNAVVNPRGILQIIEKVSNEGNQRAAAVLGKGDKPLPAARLTVEGGKELKATFTINLRLLPRMLMYEDIERSVDRAENGDPPKPAVEKK